MTSAEDVRGSVTAVADSASALVRRVRHRNGMLLLELDLSRDLAEAPPSTPVRALRGLRAKPLRDVVRALEKAAEDDEVFGLVAHTGREIGFSQVAELRAAVGRFRESGKRTAAYAETFGEMGPGNSSYHLASAFEKIWLQPTGDLGLVGLAATAVFVRGSMDKLGVQTQIGHRHEYKTAPNTFLETDLTPPHREMLESLVGSITDDIVRDVAAARALTEDAVREAVARAPLHAQEALEGGFVDRLGYRDQLYRELRDEPTDREHEPRLRFVDRYRQPRPPLTRLAAVAEHLPSPVRQQRDVIAVVGAHGAIHLGRSSSGPLSGPSAGADTVTAALRSAGRNERVRAIVLRIDSPGGSAVASDAIRRAVLDVQSGGTPVVASMASLAASGGYFIAMPCDRVVATPSTLTGSIGVWGGKQVISEGLGRIGVTRATVSAGRYADMFSTDRPFDEEEWTRVEEWLDRVYDDFTEKVAQDRAMPLPRVQELARGRVWTGSQAAEHGLVDALGGLSDAVDTACELTDTDRAKVDVRPWPRLGLMAMLRSPENSEAPAAAMAASKVEPLGDGLATIEHVMQVLAAEIGLPAYGALSMPWRITLR
ncbi:MAG TPA: signal peptide peptidase SppA [Nocardioides sp.]|jgi:protease-4|nr:signal peptide peptidase SppA [Nocardioides sp.]